VADPDRPYARYAGFFFATWTLAQWAEMFGDTPPEVYLAAMAEQGNLLACEDPATLARLAAIAASAPRCTGRPRGQAGPP
jgi:hypothetical protein